MTDHFEKAQQKILREARANGGVTTDHLLEALIATNDDLDEKLEAQLKEAKLKHEETAKWHKNITDIFDEHSKEALIRDRRLAELEDFQRDVEQQQRACPAEVQKLCEAEHEKRHNAYLLTLDNGVLVTERKFTKEQIVVAVILFLVVILATNLIGALVDQLFN